MKIVKVIIGLIVGLTLISCHNSTADAAGELSRLYPKAEIYRVNKGRYVMFDSTGVYYLRNLGFNTPKFCKLLIKKY